MEGKSYIFSGYEQKIKVSELYNNIAMVEAFSCENAWKWPKKHISRQANKKQGTADVLRCSSDYGKVTIVFLDSLKNQERYCVCI